MDSNRLIQQWFDLRRVPCNGGKNTDQIQEGGELSRSYIICSSIRNIVHEDENQVKHIIDVDEIPALFPGPPNFEGIFFSGCPAAMAGTG